MFMFSFPFCRCNIKVSVCFKPLIIPGCTFEFGLCQWTSVPVVSTSSMTTWTHQSSMSNSPNRDMTLHRKGAGHYVYVEDRSSTFKTAILRGQEFSYDDDICSLSFWYFGSTLSVGSLRVNAVLSNGSVIQRRDIVAEGGKWDWIEFSVFLWVKEMKQNNITMHVEFSAEVGNGKYFALDDIKYLQCAGYLCSKCCCVV